MEFLLKNFNAQ